MTAVALTIAGSDCSSGAGIQADLKTMQHFHVHALTAVTCVVSETPLVVRHVHPVPVEIVADQVALLLESYPIAAIKTGMLFSAAHVRAVATLLQQYPHIPLVVDPVMIASTGDALIEDDAIAAYRERLLPRATVITPNLPEAECLLGKSIAPRDLDEAVVELAMTFDTAVLLKGGHLNQDSCVDLLHAQGLTTRFTSPRLNTAASHGTGCTLSAAIAAHLALGHDLVSACRRGKAWIDYALGHSLTWDHPGFPRIDMLNQGTKKVEPNS
jgi:hydroxymethylpyrimidine/phosphomethylpyrimidine kinase